MWVFESQKNCLPQIELSHFRNFAALTYSCFYRKTNSNKKTYLLYFYRNKNSNIGVSSFVENCLYQIIEQRGDFLTYFYLLWKDSHWNITNSPFKTNFNLDALSVSVYSHQVHIISFYYYIKYRLYRMWKGLQNKWSIL